MGSIQESASSCNPPEVLVRASKTTTVSSTLISITLLVALLTMVLVGRIIRQWIPDDHLSGDSKDSVKLALGLVATMTALLLGLLISSAKGTYDTQRTQVILMASKAAFLGRVLHVYGPEAGNARAEVRDAAEDTIHRMWPDQAGQRGELAANEPKGDGVYAALQGLTPHDDAQRALKVQAASLATDLGQLRMLMLAQAVPSIPKALLIMLSFWLVIIFLGFSLMSPPNLITSLALTAGAISVAGALFLIMELDQPLGGVIRISRQPMQNALIQLSK